MSITDSLPDRGTGSQAHPWVKNIIILLLAGPPLLLLWSVGVAAVGIGYRTARYGTLPDLSGVAGVLSSDLAILAVAAALGYLYLIWANVVFGTSTVEAAKDQAEDIQQSVQEQQSDGGEEDLETE